MKYSIPLLQELGIPHLPGNWDFRTEAQQVRWISTNYPKIFELLFTAENLINWAELGRYLTKGDRNGLRKNKIPNIHKENVENLINAIQNWKNEIQKN